jgi:hypothetical protein
MNVNRKITAAAVAIMALGGVGIGTAAASSAAPAAQHSASAEPTSPDNDTLQQGNQTAPDPAGSATAKSAYHASGTPGDESSSENSESAPSDGPGGHADPSGTVQHEFNGVE